MTRSRLLVALALTAGIVAAWPADPASAHPLGNFTVNQHSGLVVSPRGVDVTLVVDMAEIPTFQTRSDIDADGDRTISSAEAAAYRQAACVRLRDGVELQGDGHPLPLTVSTAEVGFPPGQAGLPTLRLTCGLRALTGGDVVSAVDFRNSNGTDRVGWREITAVADGVVLAASDVPAHSSSDVLTRYPQDLLSSPLDQRRAHLRVATEAGPRAAPSTRVATGGGAGPAQAGPLLRGTDRFTAAFTGLVSQQHFTIWFALLALAAAIGLGALHALAPGHGKTVMAAYLVGERGSLRQAAVLGLGVTASHTAGVLVLGLVLSGSTAVVPERLYPWLGAVSGALLVAVGANLLVRAWQHRCGRHDPYRHHDDGHDHDHDHDDHHHGRANDPGIGRRTLLCVGAAGGMVPSPSALVVLLGAIALGRTWFGVALVLGYGVGMALTLVGAGLVLVRARVSLERQWHRRRISALMRALPVLTASFVVVAGIGLAARAIHQL